MLRFHIPDFQKNYNLNMWLLDYYQVLRKRFLDDMIIEFIYDSFPLIWNGGRFVRGRTDLAAAERTIRSLNERGLRIAFTFTNSLLTEEHLKDPDANRVMQMGADTGVRNCVIVNSPLLEEYIRREYPGYGIILSTTRQLRTAEEINEALQKDYELVVLDYNMNHAWEMLNAIQDKARCEFLVNACCADDCPDRGAHYRAISRQQIMNADPAMRDSIPEFRCRQGRSDYFSFRYNRNFMGIDEIRKKYEPLGFSHFKLEGRGGNRIHLLEQYMQYLVKPEYRDQTRYELLQLLSNS